MLFVTAQTKKNQQNGPFSAPFWNANSKWVEVDVTEQTKRVISSLFTVVKQKQGKPKIWHGNDGRYIGE